MSGAGSSDNGALSSALFLLLDAVEPKYPLHFSYAGHFIEVIQIIAFAVTIYSRHGETLEAVAPVLYGSQFPLFDGINYFPITASQAAGVMWAITAVLLLLVLAPIMMAVFGVTVVRKKSVIFIVPRAVLQLVCGAFFIPLMHLFVSFLACDANLTLWTYPDSVSCFSGAHSANFVGALVGGLTLLVMTHIVQTAMCDLETTSAHPYARINTSLSGILVLWKTMTVVLFHVLLPRGHSRWFAVYVAGSAAAAALSVAAMLPFYAQRMNARMCACFTVTAFLAVISAVADVPARSTIVTMDIDGAVAMCLVLPVAALGYLLSGLRVNPEYVRALPSLGDVGERPLPRPAFPEGLPLHDQSHPMYRAILAEVMDQPPTDDGGEVVLLTPFVNRIWVPTDVEVAVRFLDHFVSITKVDPGVKMLIFATRIFTKGKTRFHQSSHVSLAFANMLYMHAGKPKCSLTELDAMHERTRPDLSTRYRAHRLNSVVKVALNMRDASYQRVCTNAKKAYRDALEQVVVFWTRLTAEQQDFAMLYTVASMISAKRNAAMSEFNRSFAMNPHDRANAARYAVFADHILMETERAEAIQGALAADAEERRWSAMRGARKGGKTAGSTFDITPFLEESEEETTTSSNNRTYTLLAYGGGIFLLLVVLAYIAFSVASGFEHRQRLRGMKAFAEARCLAAHGPIVAGLFNYPNISTPDVTAVHVTRIATDLRTLQNALTFGDYEPSTAPQRRYYQGDHAVSYSYDLASVYAPAGSGAQSIAPSTVSFVTLAYDLVEKLMLVGTTNDTDARALWTGTLLDDAAYNVIGAYEHAAILARTAVEQTANLGIGIYVALFALGLVLVLLLVIVAFANASRVSVFRVSILSLFVLVPRKIVKALLDIAQARLTHIDAAEEGQEATPPAAQKPAGEENAAGTMDTAGDEEDDELLGDDRNHDDGKKQKRSDDDAAETHTTEPTLAAVSQAMFAHVPLFGLAMALAMVALGSTAAIEAQSSAREGIYERRMQLIEQHDAIVGKWFDFQALDRLLHRAAVVLDSHSAADVDRIGELAEELRYQSRKELGVGSAFDSKTTNELRSSPELVSTDEIPEAEPTTGRSLPTGSSLSLSAAQAVDAVLKTVPSVLARDALLTPDNRSSPIAVPTLQAGVELASLQRAHYQAARDSMKAQVSRIRRAAVQVEGGSARWAAVIIALCSAVLMCVAVGVALFKTHGTLRQDTATTPCSFILLTLVALVTALAPTALLIAATSREALNVQNVADAHAAIGDVNRTVSRLMESSRSAATFTLTLDLREFRSYYDSLLLNGPALGVISADTRDDIRTADEVDAFGHELSSRAARSLLRSYVALGEGTGHESASTDGAASVVRADTDELIASMRTMESVAMALAASASGLPTRHVRETVDTTWNIQDEQSLSVSDIVEPDAPLSYSNSSFDRQNRTATEQLAIARYTIASARYFDVMLNLTQAVRWRFGAGVLTDAVVEIDSAQTDVSALVRSSIAFCAALTIFCIVLVGAAVQARLFARRTYRGVRTVRTAGEAAAVPSGMGRRALPLLVSAIVVTALLVVLVALGLQSESVAYTTSSHIKAAGEAQQEIVQGMTTVGRYAQGLLPGYEARPALRRAERDIRAKWNDLLFGDADGLKVAASDDSIDAILFTEQTTSLQCGLHVGNTTDDGSLSSSYEAFVEKLSDAIDADDAQQSLEELYPRYLSTFRNFRKLIDVVEFHAEAEREVWTIVLGAAGGLVAVILVVLFFTVLQPLLQALNAEYDDATLMLRMMPQHVRENVPAVAEFIQHTLAGASGAAHVADISYSAPIVVIDDKGTVIKFNTAAEECFGYDSSEVTGNNVKMLMNDNDKKFHDEYLATYKRTGVRKVIGYERVVTAKRKSGELFPLQLNVKSLTRNSGETVYIAFLADVTRRAELTRMEELNDVVQELASVPIIAIDALGTVTRFNRAAERTFGHNSSDVIGQNVKMLMPEAVAKHHDAYLANYLRTGVKNVIDKPRRLMGVRKSGEEFDFELTVKEIVGDAGTQSTYLGFARDLTAALRLEEKNRINDQIAALSPIPVIGIDSFGMVLKFNAASERLFGYTAEEVLSKNLKMLMPEEIAVNHDGYLEAYRRTGKKSIIGGERVVDARHKDGTLIPIRIFVGEAKKEGMRPIFLGYLVDIRQELADLKSASLDDSIRSQATFPIITMNETGMILSVNQAVVQEFGYIEEELKGENIKLLMPPEIAVNHDEYLRNYKIKRVRKVIGNARRMPAMRKNGTKLMVEIRVDEANDADGNSIFIGFLRNIVSELELEQAHRINTLIQDLSLVPMLAIDAKGTVLRFNPAAERTWGYAADAVLHKNIKMLMPQFYAVQHDMYLQNYIRTGVKHVIDTTRCVEAERKDGTIFPAEVSVCEVPESSGDRAKSLYVGYVRDVTKDGEAQQMVLRNRTITALSPIPLIQIDRYGIITEFNPAAQHEFGYALDEIKDRNVNVRTLMPAETAKNHDAYLANYLRTKKKTMIGTKRRDHARRKDGSEFPIEIHVSEIIMDGEEHSFYSAYVRNIADLMELELTKTVSGVISDLSPMPLIAIRERGTVLSMNAAGLAQFGYTASEVVGKNIKMLMPEEIAKKHDGFLSAYSKTGEKHVIDTTRIVKAKRKDGTVFTAEIGVRELLTESGGEKHRMFWGFLRDCTIDIERDRSVQLAKAVLDMSSVPLVQIDHKGTILMANGSTTTTFGFSQQELVGRNVKILMPFHIAMRHDGFLQKYSDTGVKNVIDTTRIVEGQHKDGRTFKVEISVREVKLDDGKPPQFVGFLVDLTERLKRDSMNELTSHTKRSNPAPLIVIDENGYVQEFNKAAEHLWRYSAEDVIGQNVKMLMPDDIAVRHDDILATYRETGVKHVIDTTRLVHAKTAAGEHVPVKITIKEVWLPGKRRRFVGFVEDRSDTYVSLKAAVVGQRIMDMLPIGCITMTEMGNVLSINPSACKVWGYEPEEVVGQNIKMMMPEEIAVRHDDILETYRRTKVRHIVGTTRSIRGKHKNGSTFPIDIDVREYVVDGETRFCGYTRDRRSEQAAQDEAILSHAVVKKSPEMIIVMDSVGTVQEFNVAAQSKFKYTAEEVVGENIKMLMPEDIAVNHDGYLSRYVESGVRRVVGGTTKTRAIMKDGTVFPVEVRVREIAGRTRATSKFVGYLRDRTMDLVNEANAAVCDSIGSLMPDGLIVISDVGIMLTFTAQAEKAFGYKAEEVIGQNIKMLMPNEIAVRHDEILATYRRTGEKHVIDTNRRVTARKKSGKEFEVELRITEYKTATERFFIGFVKDCSNEYDEIIATTLTNSLFDVTPEAMVAIDKLGQIVNFNVAAEKLFDFNREQVLSRNVKILMPDKHALRHDQYLAQYHRHKIKRVVDNVRFVLAEKKNGATFPAEISVRETTDVKGEPLFVGYLRDMTGRVDMSQLL